MASSDLGFAARYGPWAVVAGASEGIGAEFARQLAARGLHLVLVARREAPLHALAAELGKQYGVSVRLVSGDLADPDLLSRVAGLAEDVEVGLFIYNAAYMVVAPFLEHSASDKARVVDVNCRAPLLLADSLCRGMKERGRGGIILMSSLGGLQGAGRMATYAASKSFLIALAEGLWHDLKGQGVDVLGCCPGPTRTPGYERSGAGDGPKPLEPAVVVASALSALGRRPLVIPGVLNRVLVFVLGRLLPRRVSVWLMTRMMQGVRSPGLP